MAIKKMLSREALKGKKGITLVIVALMIFVLVGIVALAIDVGHLMATRNELQNVADAAALAGAGYLGSVYKDLAYSEQQNKIFTKEEIAAVVNQVAQKNKASGENISILNKDIIIGRWDSKNRKISPETLIAPDAVYVKARRDGSANLGISTFFAGIFGINTMNVNGEATAALTGPAWVEEGELKTPFGLSQNVFPNDCTDLISFSPTTESCAGWHNFFDPINASKMEDKLLGLIQGDSACKYCGDTLLNGPAWLEANFDLNKTPSSETTPLTSAGDEFNFQGGTISSLFNGGYLGNDYNGNTGTVYGNEKKPAPITALFDYFRYRDDDGDDSVWTATIPVYKDSPDGCINPNTSIEIVGFAKIVVISPDPPPSSNIQVHVDCNLSVIEGRGGGGEYGNLKGSIPNLVK
jgi:hypothetical protein